MQRHQKSNLEKQINCQVLHAHAPAHDKTYLLDKFGKVSNLETVWIVMIEMSEHSFPVNFWKFNVRMRFFQT